MPDSHPNEPSTSATASTPTPPPDRPTIGRGETLALAVWIGSVVGLTEAALKGAYNFKTGRIYHLSRHFPWMMPASLIALIGLVALLLVLFRLKPRIDARIPLFALGFLGAFEAANWIPKLHVAASAMLAAGLTTVFMRLAVAHWDLSRRVLRVTTPLLALAVIGTAAWCLGAPWWRERQIRAALPAAPEGAPNVVLLVLDTVRADHLGAHGYKRPTTPEIEAWAERRGGYLFEHAYSSSPWSLPGHAVMFTGKWRHELGVGWNEALPDSDLTLAEHLAGRGYDTGGFVGNLAYCVEPTGLNQGFARYRDWPLNVKNAIATTEIGQRLYKAFEPTLWGALVHIAGKPPGWYHTKPADEVNAEALSWLDGRPADDRPFFLFLNYFDAHSPFATPPWYTRRFGTSGEAGDDTGSFATTHPYPPEDPKILERIIARYDDGVAYCDEAFGRLMTELERRGLADNTWVIVTSDHGELLGEHDLFAHSKTLYEPVLHVPLILIPPTGKGTSDGGLRRIATTVGLRDLAATVSNLVGPSNEPAFSGRSLERHFDPSASAGEAEDEPILAELGSLDSDDRSVGGRVMKFGHLRGVIRGSEKLIDRFLPETYEEMYDVRNDPGETDDLSTHDPKPPGLEGLRDLLESFYTDAARARLKKMDG